MFQLFGTSRLQEIPAVKGGTTWTRNVLWILPENARLPRNIQVSFTCCKSTTWDRRIYFPAEGRRAEDFFALKIQRLRSGLNNLTVIVLSVPVFTLYDVKTLLRIPSKPNLFYSILSVSYFILCRQYFWFSYNIFCISVVCLLGKCKFQCKMS